MNTSSHAFLNSSNTQILSSTALHLIAQHQMKWLKYKFSKSADDGHIIVIWELRKILGMWHLNWSEKKEETLKAQIFTFPSILQGANSDEVTDPELQPTKI